MTTLALAEERLVELVRAGEVGKIGAARLVREIHRDELWRDGSFRSFAAYLPTLLEKTASVGWGAARTIKQYIKLWAVYAEQMEEDEESIIGCVSHFNELLRVASVGKDFILDEDAEKPGTLGAVQFEGLVGAIRSLVGNEPLSAYDAQVFYEVTGYYAVMPSGGWLLDDTKEVIAAIRGEDEKPAKITRHWVARVCTNGDVELRNVAFMRGDETIFEKSFVDEDGNTDYVARDIFDQMVGKDAVELLETAEGV